MKPSPGRANRRSDAPSQRSARAAYPMRRRQEAPHEPWSATGIVTLPGSPERSFTMRGVGRALFVAILLLIAGTLNIIYGFGAVGNAHFFTASTSYVFASLHTW